MKTAIKVPTNHIPYVEKHWQQLEEARDAVAQRDEYLRTAAKLGIHTASIDRVANLPDHGSLRHEERTFERIQMLLTLGAEPTKPPNWYCGALKSPKRRFREWPDETWPHLEVDRWRTDSVAVYRGAFPIEAARRYILMQPYLDDVRVYSPEETDFKRNPRIAPRDPVLIGMVRYLGVPQYFEIARWDIDRDLAKLFGG